MVRNVVLKLFRSDFDVPSFVRKLFLGELPVYFCMGGLVLLVLLNAVDAFFLPFVVDYWNDGLAELCPLFFCQISFRVFQTE